MKEGDTITKIIYKDVAPGAKEAATARINDVDSISNINDLAGPMTMQPYATLEHNYWRLDGSFDIMPDAPDSKNVGIWSRQLSGEDGTFHTPITLSLVLPELYSSVGMTFTFNPYGADWCNHLQIKWYRDRDVVAEETFYPDAAEYFCQKEVQRYNRIMVTFYSMQKSCRRLKLADAIYGVQRTFTLDELRYVNLFQTASVISETLEVNTLDFELDSRDPVPYMFQRKQPLEVYFHEDLQGVFYISTSKRVAKTQYDISAIDMLGLLNESNHLGGIYTQVPFSSLVTQICENMPFEIDPALRNITLTGWLPIDTKRNNLAQVAFAAGAVVDTSSSQVIKIFPPKEAVSTVLDESVTKLNASIETLALVTAVTVVEHKYLPGERRTELFKDELQGTAEVLFGQPMHSLEISSGAILESNANYALISGSGEILLTGIPYTHTTKGITIVNPNVAAGDIANVVKVEAATLVSPSNSKAVAQRVYDKYQKREKVVAEAFLDNQMPGDVISVPTEFEGTKLGTIEAMDVTLDGMRTGRVTILSG